jgi:hypothetical protein
LISRRAFSIESFTPDGRERADPSRSCSDLRKRASRSLSVVCGQPMIEDVRRCEVLVSSMKSETSFRIAYVGSNAGPDSLGLPHRAADPRLSRVDLDVYRTQGSTWRGMVPVEAKRALLARHVGVAWVAGLNDYEGAQSPSVAPGYQLRLVPEPDNPVDENAVAVWDMERTARVGFIPQYYNDMLEPEHRYGLSLLEEVQDGTRIDLLIAISREPLTPLTVEVDEDSLVRKLTQLPRRQLQADEGADPLAEMWDMWGVPHRD